MSVPSIGVAIVAFNSADVIGPCLDSLFASAGAACRVVITDNASTDDTLARVRAWALERGAAIVEGTPDAAPAPPPGPSLTLLAAPINGGYAYGVNAALRVLLREPEIDLFWVLNPDCEAASDTAARYIAAGADGGFSLMSGRTLYRDPPLRIQTDGGLVDRWTGVCRSMNAGSDPGTTDLPDVRALDYLTGANFVASRAFVERAGLMREDYFLYYEEVDWAQRRGSLPLRLVPDALVYHHGGTAIGSATIDRRATPFANYFNYRNRMRFMARHHPAALPIALAYAAAKGVHLAFTGGRAEAAALLRGALGLPPPPAVRARIVGTAAQGLAFGPGPRLRRGPGRSSPHRA